MGNGISVWVSSAHAAVTGTRTHARANNKVDAGEYYLLYDAGDGSDGDGQWVLQWEEIREDDVRVLAVPPA